jgi:hypothetical protein
VTNLPKACRAACVPALLVFAATLFAAAPREVESETFRAIRVADEVRLSIGVAGMSFNETIVLSPLDLKEKRQPGRPNLLHVLIPPLWAREGGVERPAFNTLRPYYSSTHGRVRRFAVMRPDGERVLSNDQITRDCRYVLTLEFGHVVPERFTVTIGFSSNTGIGPETEFLYSASNDGYPVRSGPPESVFTLLRVNAEPPLLPWKVLQGDKVLPFATPYTVRLDRELNHVIRFAEQ